MSKFLVVGAMPVLLCCLFISCSSRQTNETVIAELKSGIEESNKIFTTSNDNIIQSLQIKKEDFRVSEKVSIWLPKAKIIANISNAQIAYIEKLKIILSDSLGNKESVQDLLSKENSIRKLYDNLSTYWQNMLAVDSRLQASIGEEIKLMNQMFFKPKEALQFEQQYFLSVNKREANSLLSKFQNNILRTENKCLLFCNEQIIYRGHDFSVFETLVGQNAQILKAGDELEITAGLGTFNRNKLPEVYVGEKLIQLNEKGFAVYKIKTASKVGHYSIPVRIGFTDEDGKPQEKTFAVKYTLVEGIKKQ